MKNEKYYELSRAIRNFKIEKRRALSENEIEIIINSFGGCNYQERCELLKIGQKGINDIHTLNKLYGNHIDNMNEKEYEFLVSSILETEKELQKEQRLLDKTNYPEDSAITHLNWRKMQLLYIKDIYGFPIDRESIFIKSNKALYNEIFKNKEEQTKTLKK